jgi:hypothetical protein
MYERINLIVERKLLEVKRLYDFTFSLLAKINNQL